MSNKPLKINDLRQLIHKGEAKDPLIFLESVMNGQDPRKFSDIYDLILEIDSFSDGEIAQSDWTEIVDFAITNAMYKPVSLSESHSAAKTLAEYLHAKRKSLELTGLEGDSNSITNDPLTEEDIELFKEKFNDEF